MDDDDMKIYNILSDICEYCISDELTLPTLQEKVKKLERYPSSNVKEDYQCHPVLHNVLWNKSVTLEIVEYLLDNFPEAATVVSENHMHQYEDFATLDTYPLHLACHNQYCPSSIITLLMMKHPQALKHFAHVRNLFSCGDYDDLVKGLPLHYYVARKSNVHIDMVKMLVDAYPQSLLDTDGDVRFTPLHAIVNNPNENINNLLHIVNFLIEVEPSLIREVDKFGRTPLLVACCNKHISLCAIQFLYNAYPEALLISDSCSWLPIHDLSHNRELGEVSSINILRFMLNIDPTLASQRNDGGCLPIHLAIDKKATEFCKVLIDTYPESLKVEASNGNLPIHIAVSYRNDRDDAVDTIQNIFDLYPENMNAIDGQGLTAFDRAAQGDRADIVELFLKYDPDLASKTFGDEHRNFPLHLTCKVVYYSTDNMKVAEVLFDAYPQAIHSHNGEGKTPLDLAWESAERNRKDPKKSKLVNFLQAQQAYARQAHDIKAKTTIDENDWLSLCCALKDKASLGSIKLLVGALRSVGYMCLFPLHIACEFSSTKVVRYLVELDNIMEDDLASLHLVHSACRGGNLEVIKYFLDEHTSLVALAEVNENCELPIQLLCEAGENTVDNENTEYVEIIWRMLLANPEALVGVVDGYWRTQALLQTRILPS